MLANAALAGLDILWFRSAMKQLCVIALSLLAACSAVQTSAPQPAVTPAVSSTLLPIEAQAMRAAGIEPSNLRCNGVQVWNPRLRAEAKAAALEMLADLDKLGVPVPPDKVDAARKALTEVVMWRMVRATVVDGDQNNLGAVAVPSVKTRAGQPVLLFRAGFTPRPDAPDSCYRSLVEQGGVRHVVNLYAGPMPTADLEAGERATVTAAGGTYATARDATGSQANWREDLRAKAGQPDQQAKREAMQAVAAIIEALLQPGGQAPAGNLLVHCGGGMHRTGMVVGIVQHCVNKTDPHVVEATYKRHVGWRSAQEPGGFEPANLAFIQDFDCSLLHVSQP